MFKCCNLCKNGMIGLRVKHNFLRQNFFEIRFNLCATVEEVKDKIYQMTGTQPQYQEIFLVRSDCDRVLLVPDKIQLRDFAPEPGMLLDVTDRNPFSLLKDGAMNDLSRVKKYELTDEEYDKRDNTVRAFLRERYATDPKYREEIDKARERRQHAITREAVAAAQISSGMRCQIDGCKRGTVKYVGEVEKIGNGLFVGVQLDEPLGNCDGSIEGARYFSGRNKFCVFSRPSKVEIGDFPELQLDLEGSDSEL